MKAVSAVQIEHVKGGVLILFMTMVPLWCIRNLWSAPHYLLFLETAFLSSSSGLQRFSMVS